jgi:hypothetical protein
MVVELYEALKEAGASERKAQAAAQAMADYNTRFDKLETSRPRPQLFLPATATNAVGTLTILSLSHFGHAGLAVPCSEMLSIRSKVSPHCSQRYA